MQTLLTLITWARPTVRWATCRFPGMRRASSTYSRVIRAISVRLAGWAEALVPSPLPAPVPVPARTPRLLVLFAALALAASASVAGPAGAAVYRGGNGGTYEMTADGRLVDVQILVDGRGVPLYYGPSGFDRRYFQAYHGRNYSLAITNNTGRRIGVLIAVDGLNAVNGDRSSLASDEPMYVLDPWERTVIHGWRSSLSQIRRFVFVDEERSYAERTNQANGDMGWIRVLAFNERGWQNVHDGRGRVNGREKTYDGQAPFGSREQQGGEGPQAQGRDRAVAPQTRGDQAAPAPEGDGVQGRGSARQMYRDAAPDAAPGTGWGDARWDPVRRVWFVPEWRATDQLVFRYEYAAGLQALGIYPRNARERVLERDRGELGFAQPPRW